MLLRIPAVNVIYWRPTNTMHRQVIEAAIEANKGKVEQLLERFSLKHKERIHLGLSRDIPFNSTIFMDLAIGEGPLMFDLPLKPAYSFLAFGKAISSACHNASLVTNRDPNTPLVVIEMRFFDSHRGGATPLGAMLHSAGVQLLELKKMKLIVGFKNGLVSEGGVIEGMKKVGVHASMVRLEGTNVAIYVHGGVITYRNPESNLENHKIKLTLRLNWIVERLALGFDPQLANLL